MSDDSAEEKKHPPSQRKLRQLRDREGQIARSRDVPSAATLIAVVLYLAFAGPSIITQANTLFVPFDQDLRLPFDELFGPLMSFSVLTIAKILLPIFAITIFVFAFGTVMDAGGFVMNPKALSPKFDRFNPVTNIKQKFGLQGLSDSGKALFSVILYAIGIAILVRMTLNGLVWSPTCGKSCALGTGLAIIGLAVAIGLVIYLLVAIVDIKISRAIFEKQNKMTDTEVKKESKENNGSPEIRRKRKELQREAQQGGRALTLEKCHMALIGPDMAVGLMYKPGEFDIPLVAFRGTGAKAATGLAAARAAGVPVVTDEALCELLVKKCAPGTTIPESAYSASARVLYRAGLIKPGK